MEVLFREPQNHQRSGGSRRGSVEGRAGFGHGLICVNRRNLRKTLCSLLVRRSFNEGGSLGEGGSFSGGGRNLRILIK